jgi:hypothetical protein
MSLSVDDLLKELDDLPNGKTYSAATIQNKVSKQQQEKQELPHQHSWSSKPKDKLDELFDDIDSLDLPPSGASKAMPNAHATFSTPGCSTPARMVLSTPKCMGLFIGGSKILRGRNGSSVGQLVCCDNLRCTKCDFKVSWFMNKEWDAGEIASYLYTPMI